MKIQISDVISGELIKQMKPPMRNRTFTYLLPCLKEYGEEFLSMYGSVLKLAIGLKDVAIEDQYQQHLFILIDSRFNISANGRISKKNFLPFLHWIREQDYYQDDYVYGDIQISPCHMVVIKIPANHVDTLSKFTEGRYSEMYSHIKIEELFSKYPEVKKVLLKDRVYKIKFVRNLNKEFNTTLNTDDYEGELDKAPVMQEECFE